MEQSFRLQEIILEREKKLAQSKEYLKKAESFVTATKLQIAEEQKELKFFKQQVVVQ